MTDMEYIDGDRVTDWLITVGLSYNSGDIRHIEALGDKHGIILNWCSEHPDAWFYTGSKQSPTNSPYVATMAAISEVLSNREKYEVDEMSLTLTYGKISMTFDFQGKNHKIRIDFNRIKSAIMRSFRLK